VTTSEYLLLYVFCFFLDFWTSLFTLRLSFCLFFLTACLPASKISRSGQSIYQDPFFNFASAVVIDKGRWKRIDCGLAGTGNAAK
jgi:hypothetical protein